MLDIIIFSKDRAAQLDLCLQSVLQNLNLAPDNCCINIVYKASSPEYQEGYDIVKKKYRVYKTDEPAVFWFGEDFCDGFVGAFNKAMGGTNKYVLFFTDDDIVYRKMEEDYGDCVVASMETEPQLFTVSLRLGSNTFVQDQYRNTNCLIPDEVIQQPCLIRVWDYTKCPRHTNFSYPFSVDGHFFRKTDVEKILEGDSSWFNPNSLEGKGQYHLSEMHPHMGCFEHSYVVNTPLNRVQDTCHNKAGKFFSHAPKELNARLLKGECLTLEGMDFSTIIGCHQEVQLKWTEQQTTTS